MGLIARSLQRLRPSWPAAMPAYEITLGDRGGLAQDLCFALVANQCGGAQAVNVVDDLPGSFTGTTPPVFATQHLIFVNGKVSFGASAMPTTADLALGAFTMIARILNGTGSVVGGVCQRSDAAAKTGWEILVNGNGAFGLGMKRGTTDFYAMSYGPGSTGFPTNQWRTLAVAYPGDLVGANVAIYLDAVKQTLSAGSSNGSGIQASDFASAFELGYGNFTAGPGFGLAWGGSIDYLYLFRRYLRQDDILLLTADPFRMFRRPTMVHLSDRLLAIFGGPHAVSSLSGVANVSVAPVAAPEGAPAVSSGFSGHSAAEGSSTGLGGHGGIAEASVAPGEPGGVFAAGPAARAARAGRAEASANLGAFSPIASASVTRGKSVTAPTVIRVDLRSQPAAAAAVPEIPAVVKRYGLT
jgi:hypothetical protein